MSTNPALLAGHLPTYSFEADSLGGADGSVVSTLGPYAVPAGYAGPTLRHDARNGLKSLVFAPGRALNVVVPPVAPPPNLSGGAFPDGVSVMAVVRATDLSSLSAPPHVGSRRTIVGWRGQWNSLDVPGGLEVYTNGRIAGSMISHPGLGYWGWNGPNGTGIVGLGSWYVLGLTCDGQNVRTFKGLNLDRTGVNDGYAAGYRQFIGGFTLGADAAFPGLQDWTGDVAAVHLFDRALTLADYRSGATWLLTRYNLPLREIAVDARIGTSGKYAFVSFRSSSTNDKAYVPRSETIPGSAVTYRVNGGSPVTPSALYYQPVTDAVPSCALVAFPLATPAAPTDAITVSIAANAIPTNEGYVDELLDGPAANYAGQFSMIPQELPAGAACKQGYNITNAGQYWTSEGSLKNLLKCSGDNYGSISVDALGYRLSPHVGLRYLVRSGSADATDGSRAVTADFAGAEFGRYVVTWEGADGSNLAIEGSASDAGQTTVTPVAGMDVLTGPTKKRYFDVARAPGQIRERPCFDLVYKAAVYVTNVEVKLARYEGTTGIYADQMIERAVGCEGWRFMDFFPTNFSNIAHPGEFAVNNSLGYGSQTRRTIPIARIDSYEGTHYATDTGLHHYVVTTTVPHGIANGQSAMIESTNGQPINVTHPSGVVNMVFKGWIGHAVSPTQFYFADYTPGSDHEVTTVPFTGTNAILSVTVAHGAPVQAACALVNETNAKVMNLCVPHAATDAAIRHLAEVCHATLLPGKKVDLELSNEVWNFAFSQYTYFRSESIRRGLVPQSANDPYPSYIARTAEMWDVFRARWVELGRSAADLAIVLNFQQTNATDARTCAVWLQANRPDIAAVKVAVAPYHYWNGLYNVPGLDYAALTVEECLDFQEAWKVAEKPWFYDAQLAQFSTRGITPTLIAYEYQWAYMGLGPEGAGATRDERWDLWNRINLAVVSHPRNYGIQMLFMKELQDRGMVLAYRYGHNGGPVYEHAVVGNGYYGTYQSGLTQVAKRGDGSDGGPDNRPLTRDALGRAKWPPRMLPAAPMGAAMSDWMAATSATPTLRADWAAVATPRTASVSSIALTFNMAVSGVSLSDVTLTRDGQAVTLTGTATLSGSGASYTLSGLATLTSAVGVYVLTLTAADSGIATTTPTLIELAQDAVRVFTVEAAPTPPSPSSLGVPQPGVLAELRARRVIP